MPQITVEEIAEESLVALRAAVEEYQHIDVELVVVLTRAIGTIEGLQTMVDKDKKEIADLKKQIDGGQIKPRAKTVDEVRAEFLEHLHMIAREWASYPDKTPLERCDGVIFSVLVAFDGGSGFWPAMDIKMAPHPEDKEFCREQGQDWFEPGMLINDCQLHEMYFKNDETDKGKR